jgi:hydroxymethylbilane synthase
MKYVAASRGSKLALRQTGLVLDELTRLRPTDQFEIISINTKGDVDPRPLFSMDRKGLFEKEVNNSVLNRHADFGVHSLKDIPTDLHPDLSIAAVPKRAKPNDVMVSKKKVKLATLTKGSKVGTSSLRRAIQILQRNPSLDVVPIRGNVETRINKSLTGIFDAVVLAEAGLIRLGMQDVIVERLDVRNFLPAPGQGAMAVICRRDNLKMLTLLQKIEHEPSRRCIEAERALMRGINAGCRFPVGALAKHGNQAKTIQLSVKAMSTDRKKSIKVKLTGKASNPTQLGYEASRWLIQNGIEDIASGWRDALNSWNII